MIMNLLPFIPVLVCILIYGSSLLRNVNANKQDNDDLPSKLFLYDPDDKPESLLSIGSLFDLHTTYNETKMRNKLRLSKGYIKTSLLMNSFGPKTMTIAQNKISGLEELLRCDQLNSTRHFNEFNQMIDCKPIAAHVVDDTLDPAGSPDYRNELDQFVRRSSFRMKTKLLFKFGLNVQKSQLLLYPLKEDVAKREIELRGEECNVTDKNFFRNNLNLGHYFDFKISDREDGSGMLQCTGESYLSVNRTQILARYSNDLYPEFADEFDYLVSQSMKNGYLLSLKDVECGFEDFKPWTLNMDFTIIQRKQFPYLAVRHKIETSPINLFFKFNSTVDQVLHSEFGDPFHYNTTIKIHSRAPLMDTLSFELSQVFVNNGTEGFENMQLIKGNSALLVNAMYNSTIFAKLMQYYHVDHKTIDETKTAEAKIKNIFNLAFANSIDNEQIKLELAINKKALIAKLTGLSDLFDVNEKELEKESIKEEESTKEEEKEEAIVPEKKLVSTPISEEL